MDAERVERALEGLTADGVLTDEQAAAVRAALAEPTSVPPAAPGIHPAAEAAAWVGAVLATAAGLTAASAFWAELARWAQSGLLLLACAALLAAGLVVRDDPRPAARRILSVVWFLAVAAFGAALVVGLDHDAFPSRPWPPVAAAAAATALAVPLWRRHRAALQLLAVVASAGTTLLALLELAERPPSELYGLLAWAVGVALILLAWAGLAEPVRTGLWAGAVLALAGCQALTFSYQRGGVLLFVLTLAGLFALGGVRHDAILTGIASVGLAIALPQALDAWFPDSLNASATVFLSGVALLAGALATIRRAQRPQAPALPATQGDEHA